MGDTPKDYITLNNTGDEIKKILDSQESTPPGQFYQNENALNEHIDDDDIHVTKSDKERWNQKLGENHRESLILDHPDGSVTKEKLSTDLLELISSGVGGSVTPEQIQEAVEEYLKKNPLTETDPTVPDWAKQPNKPTYTADEVGTYSKERIEVMHASLNNAITTLENEVIDIDKDVAGKADKSDTYNKEEVNAITSSLVQKATFDTEIKKKADKETVELQLVLKADKSTTLAGYGITDAYTKVDTDSFLEKMSETVVQKLEETVLHEVVVSTSPWTNQPTYEGTFDSAFNKEDFYYVTLKDALGNSLDGGQFMLKSSYDDTATVYSTVFTLEKLNTGATTLTENYPVEFFEIGASHRMGDAGVSAIIQDIDAWNISNGTGSIRIVVQGEVIPMSTNLYHYSHFKTDENVKFYHSTNATSAFQGESTKDIVAYTNFPELNNVGNMLFDDTVLKKDGDRYFSVERKVVVRYNEKYKNSKVYQIYGFGKALSDDINITSVALRMNSDKNGVFRNGTKIIVSEVK